jgi:hypothetical protein
VFNPAEMEMIEVDEDEQMAPEGGALLIPLDDVAPGEEERAAELPNIRTERSILAR